MIVSGVLLVASVVAWLLFSREGRAAR